MPNQDQELTSYARDMRRDPTRAEALLWWSLCRKSLGVKFRRQVPIGPFIVDFACYSHKLVIEIDGLTHDSRGAYDQRRDQWLRARGWTILRFGDEEVWEERNAVIGRILLELGEEP